MLPVSPPLVPQMDEDKPSNEYVRRFGLTASCVPFVNACVRKLFRGRCDTWTDTVQVLSRSESNYREQEETEDREKAKKCVVEEIDVGMSSLRSLRWSLLAMPFLQITLRYPLRFSQPLPPRDDPQPSSVRSTLWTLTAARTWCRCSTCSPRSTPDRRYVSTLMLAHRLALLGSASCVACIIWPCSHAQFYSRRFEQILVHGSEEATEKMYNTLAVCF